MQTARKKQWWSRFRMHVSHNGQWWALGGQLILQFLHSTYSQPFFLHFIFLKLFWTPVFVAMQRMQFPTALINTYNINSLCLTILFISFLNIWGNIPLHAKEVIPKVIRLKYIMHITLAKAIRRYLVWVFLLKIRDNAFSMMSYPNSLLMVPLHVHTSTLTV